MYSKVPNAFGPSEVQLFESLAQEIGFGLRSIERQHKLDDQIHEKELVQKRVWLTLYGQPLKPCPRQWNGVILILRDIKEELPPFPWRLLKN